MPSTSVILEQNITTQLRISLGTNFTWDDGTPWGFNKILPKVGTPDSCLAIVPIRNNGVNEWIKPWEDVNCNRAKAYFICAYTNGNFFIFVRINRQSPIFFKAN